MNLNEQIKKVGTFVAGGAAMLTLSALYSGLTADSHIPAHKQSPPAAFDKTMVERLRVLVEEIDHKQILRERGGQIEYLEFLVDEAERYLANRAMPAAEVTLRNKIYDVLSPEQMAVLHEAQIRDHEAKIARGEFSAFGEVQKIIESDLGRKNMEATSAEARKKTINTIIRMDEMRREGIHRRSPGILPLWNYDEELKAKDE